MTTHPAEQTPTLRQHAGSPRIEHRIRLADGNDLSRLHEIATEAYGSSFTNLAALQEEGNLFVAEWRTALDAFIVLLPLHEAMLVHRLGVAADMRRRGLGGWLLDFAVHHAHSAGMMAAEAQLQDSDRATIAWLARRGFLPAHRTGNRALLRRPVG